MQVGTFICILANPVEERLPAEEESKSQSASRKLVINNAPLFSQEEFYCFVRPKLLIYSLDQSDEMMELRTPQDLLRKLRPPLSLNTMRKYFREMTQRADDDKFSASKEAAFQKNDDMSDSDTFAFAFLSEYFKERLRKVNTF